MEDSNDKEEPKEEHEEKPFELPPVDMDLIHTASSAKRGWGEFEHEDASDHGGGEKANNHDREEKTRGGG